MLDRSIHSLDSPIQRINHYPADKYSETDRVIHWMVIYPMDSFIQLFNNWALVSGKKRAMRNYIGVCYSLKYDIITTTKICLKNFSEIMSQTIFYENSRCLHKLQKTFFLTGGFPHIISVRSIIHQKRQTQMHQHIVHRSSTSITWHHDKINSILK